MALKPISDNLMTLFKSRNNHKNAIIRATQIKNKRQKKELKTKVCHLHKAKVYLFGGARLEEDDLFLGNEGNMVFDPLNNHSL